MRDEFSGVYEGRTVLVTGADGFMGSHLTEALVALGAGVHAFVRATSSGALNNIGFLRRQLKVHFADLTDKTSIDYVIRELGRWGFELMPGTDPDYAFRSHWLALPVSLYLHDRESGGPPATIEVRLGDDPVILEAVEGEVRTRPRTETDDPDLVVSGPPLAFLGLISRKLDLAAARARGLHTEGELAALERLLPEPAASAPAP